MNQATAKHLVALNYQFYQTFAAPFSATRQRLQPGVQRLLARIAPGDSVLDLGCGNGELGHVLAERRTAPETGSTAGGLYLGLDFSPGLLQTAVPGLHLAQADLTQPGWSSQIRSTLNAAGYAVETRFAVITCFAVLHHIPGAALRQALLSEARQWLAPGGWLALSAWQFLSSERLRGRIQPWELAGLHAGQLDPGDYLLDWRAGGQGLRYAHHFDEAELADLAAASGMRVSESFYADGKNGRLGLYQLWMV